MTLTASSSQSPQRDEMPAVRKIVFHIFMRQHRLVDIVTAIKEMMDQLLLMQLNHVNWETIG